MRTLIGCSSIFGAIVGTVLLGALGVTFYATNRNNSVVYEGSLAESNEGEIGPSFIDLNPFFRDASNWWTQLWLPWWSFPLIGAATGAVVATLLVLAGVRVVRTRS
ncbi:hypothetical protein [Rhodococcoides corynebacterioides]|uniref:hypothetical protein n=1 Tax=Rhodococcoides corynebacterioides TaxID=53972 RepID=UPI001C9B5B3C|nr:hypothetical protein [Rhodococcus corynebacterioides]MBY6364319.1 hypothetical protein [Rhodococcus corynebacterioides]